MSKRRNGECSIFAYRNGYAAYAWVTTPEGERKRKWVYGKTHDEVHAKWIKLQGQAHEGPVPTSVPTVSQYTSYWLREVVKPNLAPKTYEKYEAFARLHIVPYLGTKRLDKLQVKDIRQWLNKLAQVCQCCAQGKDAARASGQAPLLRDRPVLRRNPVRAQSHRRPRHAPGRVHVRGGGGASFP